MNDRIVLRLQSVLSWVGLCSTLGLALLLYGMGASWSLDAQTNKFIPEGFNPYSSIAGRFALIGALYLIFGLIEWKFAFESKFLRSLQIVCVFMMLFQTVILINSMPNQLPSYVERYSPILQLVLYSGYFVLTLSVGLLILFGIRVIAGSSFIARFR